MFMLLGSGIGNRWALMGVGLLSMMGVFVARVQVKEISYLIRRMTWFFLAIVIFPVLFTPEFYIDLPLWFIYGSSLLFSMKVWRWGWNPLCVYSIYSLYLLFCYVTLFR
jgi:hypothetical protein